MRIVLLTLLLIAGLALGPWACSENPESIVNPSEPAMLSSVQGSLEKVAVINVVATQYGRDPTIPGEIKFVGARMIIKGMEFDEPIESESSYMEGTVHLTMNASLDANQEGPCQGKWTIYPEADFGGGVWEGTWEGYQTITSGGDIISHVMQVGHGRGGTLEGMKIIGRSEYVNGIGTINATITLH